MCRSTISELFLFLHWIIVYLYCQYQCLDFCMLNLNYSKSWNLKIQFLFKIVMAVLGLLHFYNYWDKLVIFIKKFPTGILVVTLTELFVQCSRKHTVASTWSLLSDLGYNKSSDWHSRKRIPNCFEGWTSYWHWGIDSQGGYTEGDHRDIHQ